MTLDPRRLPPSAIPLIPMAERWNIGDDGDRGMAIRALGDRELLALARCFEDVDEDFWDWLATTPDRSPEYFAMVILVMAMELANVLVSKREEQR
ncbi:MAG TPA: hypothetical protein VF062_12940 [Candidatus Limnocylindrales bacterium]